MSEEHITVGLDEEYGYRMWVWQTGMTEAELIAWWEALPSVMPYFFSPEGLPGALHQAGWVVRNEDGTLRADTLNDPIDSVVGCAGFTEGTDEIVEGTFLCMKHPWKAHIHMDDDSFLRHGHEPEASIRIFKHAGYGRDLQEE
tara:strand:- start:395 stop:823 length:429 start_codon:yes stop_codon:yes gene_type:complete